MKNLLMCGAALSTVLAFATPSFASESEGVKLQLGGYFKGYVSAVSQDETAGTGIHAVDILRDTEVHFTGQTTLDSGLTVGAHFEGQADAGDSFNIDESYVFFSGDWGRINFGGSYGTAFLLQVVAPAANPFVDGRYQLIAPMNYEAAGITGPMGRTDYSHATSGNADKISYITPYFSGFQAGVTYTPDSDSSRALSGNASDSDDTTASSDIWDLALRYEGKISDSVNYRAGAGYTRAQVETGSADDREAWNVALDFDIGAFGIGAAYFTDNEGDADNDVDYVSVGADYTLGSVTYGASYYNKDNDITNVDLNRYSLGAVYKYGPGMSFNTSLHYYDVNQGSTDAQGTALLVGTEIAF